MLYYSIDIVNYFTDNSTRYTQKEISLSPTMTMVKSNNKRKDIKITHTGSSFIINYDKTVSKIDKRIAVSI